MEIKVCKACGFILDTRPNMKSENGICLSCLNKDRKNSIDWKERQKWLTAYIEKTRNRNVEWDCVVGVSGGKDSCAIVKRLFECHGVKKHCWYMFAMNLHRHWLGYIIWIIWLKNII